MIVSLKEITAYKNSKIDSAVYSVSAVVMTFLSFDSAVSITPLSFDPVVSITQLRFDLAVSVC